jgi:hypothetical protein
VSAKLRKVQRIADWLAGSAESLTPDEIRMAAQHLRDVVDGRPFSMAAVAQLNRTGRIVTTGDLQAAALIEGQHEA